MRSRPTFWFIISLLCLAGAYYFWRLGDEWAADKKAAPAAENAPRSVLTPSSFQTLVRGSTAPVVAGMEQPAIAAAAYQAAGTNGFKATNLLAYRLTNTTKSVGQLLRNDRALLLENAVLETGRPVSAGIPERLRAKGDPGSYIAQARRPLDDDYRALLKAAGASIVSYIPNNAYLVRMNSGAASSVESSALTQTVLPYEPYYKLKWPLLKHAVDETALPFGSKLNVLVFDGALDQTVAQLEQLGATVLAREHSVLLVQPSDGTLADIAGLPGVQVVELNRPRAPANDLSRARIGVAEDSITATNLYELTGKDVWVAVNDSGVDATHPDLLGRVFGDRVGSLVDTDGHGTHVAGIIAGDGSQSMTVSNASGSTLPPTNGQFRGMAPAATIFSVAAATNFNIGPFRSDAYLQETGAMAKALISNNGWIFAGDNSYGIGAASYDAAVRDALPGVMGSQPVTYVFAAGNNGGGADDGTGGSPDTILSPGTAKNVITVGAIEQPRSITNEVIKAGTTNGVPEWKERTSAGNQVAAFSARGNVGIGVEGDFGRFKPDVVAPGTFVISTRSTQWDEAAYYNPTNHHLNRFRLQLVKTNALNRYSIFVPENAVQLNISIFPNILSPVPMPDLPIYMSDAGFPTLADFVAFNDVSLPPDRTLTRDTTWRYSVGNQTTQAVRFDIFTDLVTTNDNGNYFVVLSNLNNSIQGTPESGSPPHYYRYESGTSIAAPAVSGMLALIQEFFRDRVGGVTLSPAAMKALLINGAVHINNLYNFDPHHTVTYEGWGLVNLPNSLLDASNALNHAISALQIFDQVPAEALATGQSRTRTVTVPEASQGMPLRFTLVWTDPPGNPAAGVKLVNDLDLVVTNLDTGDVYFGNDFQGDVENLPWDTNAPPRMDSINNVENIYLPPGFGTNYTVTVIGHRVNVNAVTAHPNDVAQDYALVISCGDAANYGPGQLDTTQNPQPVVSSTTPLVDRMTNGFAGAEGVAGNLLLGQHVGASTPLRGNNTVPLANAGFTNGVMTVGLTNQWHFYVFTNDTNFAYAAFVTLLPSTFSLPRMGVREDSLTNATRIEPDIDLYVSTDPNLTNLVPAVLAAADKSQGRGGTEFIVYSNSVKGRVYYIGVKSEDQMAAEYAFLGVVSLEPFGTEDNGDTIVRGLPLPSLIPDGSPGNPGSALMIGLALTPRTVRRVIVTNTIAHENLGDLVGNLSHNNRSAVLNNHRSKPDLPAAPGPYGYIYEDNGESDMFAPNASYLVQPSDGPGSLRTFVGEKASGVWLLTMVDNSLNQTGHVQNLRIRIQPSFDFDGGTNRICVPPGVYILGAVDVPPEAVRLTVGIISNEVPIQLFARRDEFPAIVPNGVITDDTADKAVIIPVYADLPPHNPPRELIIDKTDTPPLNAGRYFVSLYNPSTSVECMWVYGKVDVNPAGVQPSRFASVGSEAVFDDAVTNSTRLVTTNGRIARVEVGLRIDHPRISDLALTLVSPNGTRVLLMENRGGLTTEGAGSTLLSTNVFPQQSAGGFLVDTNIIQTGQNEGVLIIDYEFFPIPDELRVHYDNGLIFNSGLISGNGQFVIPYGPGASTDLAIVMNQGNNTNTDTGWNYTATVITRAFSYLNFTENTNLTTTPIKYAIPPFRGAGGSIVFSNGFEGAAAVLYAPTNSPFDGWTVESNQVVVLNDPALAHTGNQLLALSAGQITHPLPNTIAGRRYLLNYAYRNFRMMDGPIAWWPAEGNAVDIVNANNGTMGAGATFGPGFVGGQAFDFAGGGAVVRIGDPDMLKLTNSFTFEGWINSRAYNGISLILFRGDTRGCFDPYYLAAFHAAGGGLRFHVESEPYVACGVDADTTALPLNQWNHLAGVFDGTSGDMRLYVDGVLKVQKTSAEQPFRDLNPGSVPMVAIGNFGNGDNDGGVNGRIDELSIFNRALSATEIGYIVNAGTAGKCAMALPPAICLSPSLNGLLAGPFVNPANSHYYYLLSNNTWTASETWAVALGGHLATINDANENDWILSTLSTFGGLYHSLWIGFNDPTHNDPTQTTNFVWASGQPVTYTNWRAGEPNVGFGSDYYAYMYPSNIVGLAGQWNNISDLILPGGIEAPLYGVVELEQNPISTPTKAQVSVPGVTNTFTGGNSWQIGTLSFTATQNPTTLSTRGLQPAMLLDSFTLSEMAQDAYYLPEESLDVLKGQQAQGEWHLELWDNRAGAPAPVDSLLSWRLNFVFEDTIPQTRFTNTICGIGITNLLITVPPNALLASNVLVSATGPVNVFFNPTNPATGDVPPDFQMLTLVTNGTFVFTPFTYPPLPGSSYYIGIQNLDPTNCVTFVYDVSFGYTAPFPAFPGAEGPGIGAVGGRGGGVYHVVNLNDSGPGSLRYGITNATGPRTIVFDVSGNINLLSDLKITNSYLTIAGQTAPGDGITLQGRLTSVQNTHDVVIRYLRFRPGDINCPTNQNDSFHFDYASNSIVDHISASWSIDEVLSATDSTNVTVQWSMIAEALNNSCHVAGPHGYGSLLRYGAGSLGFHHNLYAHNSSRNPRLGDNLSLDFVNNVIYNWGILPGYSEDDSADNPGGFTNRLNYVGNYLIAGTNTAPALRNTAFRGGSTNTWIYQSGNAIDGNTDGILDGTNTGFGMFTSLYTPIPSRFDQLPLVTTYDVAESYERVLAFVGTSLDKRDAVDLRLVNSVRAQTNGIIDSQSDVGGWPALNSVKPFPDSDQDGMPDYWEVTLGLNPFVVSTNDDRDLDGYTDLEEYINWLAVPHALVLHDSTVDVDLRVVTGGTGNLAFNVFDGTNGTVVLLTNGYTARFTPTPAYTGFASFGFTATNLATGVRFGPVPVSVLVSSILPAADVTIRIIRYEFITNSFCITWTSVPGTNYVVQGKPDLTVTNWDVVSPVITATDLETTWCIALPSPYHFFRVLGGVAGTNAPPTNAITLASAVPYCNTNSGVGGTNDYYIFTVSSNAVRAQFEINGPTGDMTLVARKGFPPLPDLTAYDYISANSYTNDELIVVFDFSSPVPLSPGDWYLAAVNISGGPVSYCIKATEYPVYGTNLNVTVSVSPGAFCLTWDSLIGVHYVVQGKTNVVTPGWNNVSSTITATSTQTTYCVALPSPYSFFRVIEGLALSTNLPPTIIPQIGSVTATNGGFLIEWNAPTNLQFQVQWAGSITPPITWASFSNIISSTTGQFSFLDDGTQAPFGPVRFYRLRLYP